MSTPPVFRCSDCFTECLPEDFQLPTYASIYVCAIVPDGFFRSHKKAALLRKDRQGQAGSAWKLAPPRSSLSENAVATHSSTLAWKILWTEEPGRLQYMGLWRVGHDWVTSLSLFTFMHWRRKWQPTPVFLPEESQGWWSLVGCCVWGHTESGTT